MPDNAGVPFVKMHGAANDFVVIDMRRTLRMANPGAFEGLVVRMCDRRRGIGADGVLLLEPGSRDPRLDFTMRYFNRDGRPAEFCGNGARCLARLALDDELELSQGLGIPRDGVVRFASDAGVQQARAEAAGAIELLLHGGGVVAGSRAVELDAAGRTFAGRAIDTGVPHLVVEVERVEEVPLPEWGAALRHHVAFEPGGTNVDFVTRLDPTRLVMRTYERGVEAETLACGTGAVACGLVAMEAEREGEHERRILTAGGDELTVRARRQPGGFERVRLVGPAEVAFTGVWHGDVRDAVEVMPLSDRSTPEWRNHV